MSRQINDRNLHQQHSKHNIQSIEDSQLVPNKLTVLPQIKLPSSGPYIVIKSIPKNLQLNDETRLSTATDADRIIIEPSLQSANLSFGLHKNAAPAANLDSTSPILKKRIKLESADSVGGGSTNITDDLAALKAKILEHKLQRLKELNEK